jgi:hypothetical protein
VFFEGKPFVNRFEYTLPEIEDIHTICLPLCDSMPVDYVLRFRLRVSVMFSDLVLSPSVPAIGEPGHAVSPLTMTGCPRGFGKAAHSMFLPAHVFFDAYAFGKPRGTHYFGIRFGVDFDEETKHHAYVASMFGERKNRPSIIQVGFTGRDAPSARPEFIVSAICEYCNKNEGYKATSVLSSLTVYRVGSSRVIHII